MTKAKTQKHKDQLEAQRRENEAIQAQEAKKPVLPQENLTQPDKKKSEADEPAPEPVSIRKLSINDDDWLKIVDQFKLKYGQEPEEDGSLVFPSQESAIEFFTDQASQKREFLAQQMRDGKPTGFTVFSCGDGTLYQGTVEEIKSAIELANKANPQPLYTKALKALSEIPSVNQTNSMRDALGTIKSPEPEPEAKPQPGPR